MKGMYRRKHHLLRDILVLFEAVLFLPSICALDNMMRVLFPCCPNNEEVLLLCVKKQTKEHPETNDNFADGKIILYQDI